MIIKKWRKTAEMKYDEWKCEEEKRGKDGIKWERKNELNTE
jgi:hypothetical protein